MRHLKPNFLCVALCTLLAACSDDSGSTPAVESTLPTVTAGSNKLVDEGATVALDGAVTDTFGAVVIEWSQVSGPMVAFNDTSSLSPVITAPRIRSDAEVVLRLTITDGASVFSDDVTVTIANLGNGPRGPSPQGIDDDDLDDRRNRRRNGRRMIDSREVRTYDGSSNNLDHPEWGATFAHLQRLGQTDYADGASSLAGPERPSARVISNVVVHQDEGVSIPNRFGRSDMVWQWGQFIDHDVGLTDGAFEEANIPVPEGDPQFDPLSLGAQFIPFNRARFDLETGISVDSPRQQENEITSWIDGSMIYGSDEDRTAALRVAEDSPFLASSEGNLLPFNSNSLPNANGFVQDPTELFLAGDVRVNEQVSLTSMHTLWMREHNRIAQLLVDANFSADPDVVFEQTRRLVIAKIQKITFEEYLPALHGDNPLPDYAGYDPSINPTMYNEFNVAAYRFGHSLLNEQLLRLDAGSVEIEGGHLDLRAAFFTAPNILSDETSVDSILRGLASQAHQARDPFVIQDLRNFLFGAPGDGGLDLAALNIQRGRDHGVPSYNNMRVVMGLVRYTTFEQITSDADTQIALSTAYGGDVDLVDLWVGGLAEDAIGDSQFGELFDAIILRQFRELRDGDRFWYERDLTSNELQMIEEVTLAQVIRANTSIGSELQDDVFTTP